MEHHFNLGRTKAQTNQQPLAFKMQVNVTSLGKRRVVPLRNNSWYRLNLHSPGEDSHLFPSISASCSDEILSVEENVNPIAFKIVTYFIVFDKASCAKMNVK